MISVRVSAVFKGAFDDLTAAVASIFGLRTAAQKTADASVQDWYVSATGTTTGTGVIPGDRITPAELSRRLDGLLLTVTGFMTVHYDAAGDPSGALYVTWHMPPNSQLAIVGVPTSTGVTGTITSWVTIDKTASTPGSYGFTDSALPSDSSFSSLIRQRARITSGARAGCCMPILKDQNTNTTPIPKTARVPPPYLADSSYPFDFTKFSKAIPANGDPYVIETIPSLQRIYLLGTFDPNGEGPVIQNLNVEIVLPGSDLPNPVQFLNCISSFLQPMSNGTFTLLGGIFNGGIMNGGLVFPIGVGIMGTFGLQAGGSAQIQDCTSQGAQILVQEGATCLVYNDGPDGLQIFDTSGSGLSVDGGRVNVKSPLSGVCTIGGSINNGAKIVLSSGIVPTLHGASNQAVTVDGLVQTSWANYRDRLTGSAIFPSNAGLGP